MYLSKLLAPLFILTACAGETPKSEIKETRPGYTDIMSPSKKSAYVANMPQVADAQINSLIQDANTMWYDKQSMVPGYQDSMGDPKGMRPNTVRSSLIDTAVPGGHQRLFKKKGQFHYPFGTGGLDDSSNAFNIFFWHLPKNSAGEQVPVAYWKESFSRWRWIFPVGTVLGEVLFVKFPDGEHRVFEIRTRTRTLNDWENNIYRPFPTAASLARAIQSERPNWQSNQELTTLVNHLNDSNNLQSKSLSTTAYLGSIEPLNGYLDVLPTFGDESLVKSLLSNSTFKSVIDTVWKQRGEKTTFAASTNESYGITANNYNGGLFQVNDDFCSKCHDSAGRSIREFHDELMAYGELWGEDETFSWHLFETEMFVDASTGIVRNWNNDNRRLRSDFQEAGIVTPYSENGPNNSLYRQLSRSWQYNPF